ncbi:unnamed protein product [Cunninghamella blakesleeana]
MFTQYINSFINNFDQRKTIDQIQKVATSKEGVIGIATAVVLMAGVSVYNSKKFDRGCPRVPDSSLIYGSTEEYRKDPKGFVTKWQKELGDVYSAFIFGHEAVVVSGTQVREVFLNDNLSFTTGVKKLFDANLLTNSRLGDDDDNLELVRWIKLCLNPNLKHYTPRVIDHLTQGFDEFSGDINADGKVYNHVFPMMQHMVAKASASVIVGIELAKNEQLIDSFKNMVIEVGSELKPKPILELVPTIDRLRMWMVGKTSHKVKKHRQQLADALKPEIESRLEKMKLKDSNWERPDDILQHIIESGQYPHNMNVNQYSVEIMTLFIFAALHTTSENGTVALYRILGEPGLIDELLKEQNEVLESEGIDSNCGPEVFTREILNKFVKLDSAIREAFRVKNVHISLPHTNITNKNVILSSGAIIRPGESAYINIYANHTDPNVQKTIDDLKIYNPFRFVNAEKNSAKIGDDFLFFGMGKHACPGRWFAIQEIKTVIAYLIRRFEIEALDRITFPTLDRQPFPFGRFKLTPRK